MDTAGYAKGNDMEMDFVDAAGRLVAYLKAAHRSEDAATVFVMAAYITQMEEKMDQAVQQITELKNEINLMQENQTKETESLKGYLEELTEALHVQYGGVKSELKGIKQDFSGQAHKIVENTRQKGVEALNDVSEFFKIRERMQRLQGKITAMLSGVEQAIARIDAFGRGMQEAKRQSANAIRALMGKPERESSEKGFMLAGALKKPFLAQKKLLGESLICVNKVLEKCRQLNAAARAAETEKLPEKTEELPEKTEELPGEMEKQPEETEKQPEETEKSETMETTHETPEKEEAQVQSETEMQEGRKTTVEMNMEGTLSVRKAKAR